MGYSICIDIGGTFTDCVVSDDTSRHAIFKAPSTPDAFERGFMDVLSLAAADHGIELSAFLAETHTIVHGTTVSTNALVEGKTAEVGLICNEGHPDVLTLREAPRKRAFEWRLDYPEPFVPRNRTCEVGGRIDALGNEVEPLRERDVHDAIAHFKACGVEAIAVCLLWSIVNPAHERRVGEIVRQVWPDVSITLSHELNPIQREYRRTISTAIDASLHGVVGKYLGALERALQSAGFGGTLLIANCVGGMMPIEEIARTPIYSIMSGPTLAPIAALNLTEERDVVVVDMGGTTFDVSAIRDRQLIITPEAMIGHDLVGIPKIDVRSVGAGGGSIAWVDVGGLLRVGPESAGAKPGPACYGAGGTRPTVTDANLVLGILDSDYFLGGRVKLDVAAAEAAIGGIARALDIDLLAAAYAIHVASNHNMIAAIEDITINEGIDPRDGYFVAGGGATACHIGEMAKALGLDRFMIPSLSAGLSAYGGLVSDIRREETATRQTNDRRFDLERVNDLLRQLRARGDAFLDRAGVPKDRRRYEHFFQARYKYQSWEIDVPFDLPPGGLRNDHIATLASAFHAMHERIYTIKDEDDEVEFTTWKVRAIGDVGAASRRGALRPDGNGHLPVKGRRPVYLGEIAGRSEVPVYDGNDAGAGTVTSGPAIIEEATTTILVLDGQTARTDAWGNYLLESNEGGNRHE